MSAPSLIIVFTAGPRELLIPQAQSRMTLVVRLMARKAGNKLVSICESCIQLCRIDNPFLKVPRVLEADLDLNFA
jgi:hypothetical protein